MHRNAAHCRQFVALQISLQIIPWNFFTTLASASRIEFSQSLRQGPSSRYKSIASFKGLKLQTRRENFNLLLEQD